MYIQDVLAGCFQLGSTPHIHKAPYTLVQLVIARKLENIVK
jgi:hypothetical protein